MTSELLKQIDAEKTIEEFGYDPREIRLTSRIRVMSICPDCGERRSQHIWRMKLSATCLSCAQKKKNASMLVEPNNLPLDGVDVDGTIAAFGYDPRLFKSRSNRIVLAYCVNCGKPKGERIFQDAITKKDCLLCSKKTGEDHWLFGKHQTDEVKAKISNSRKGIGHTQETKDLISLKNKGKKRSVETRKRISETKFGDMNPQFGRRGKLSHLFGKPAPITFGKGYGRWHTKKDGRKVWFRSSWEYKFALYLDEKGIDWEYEHKSFPVSFVTHKHKELSERNYWPDFFVNGEWIEIKGYWREDAKAKFEAFKAQHPNEKIRLLMRPELLALGIDVK